MRKITTKYDFITADNPMGYFTKADLIKRIEEFLANFNKAEENVISDDLLLGGYYLLNVTKDYLKSLSGRSL